MQRYCEYTNCLTHYDLLVELMITISKLKELYKTIDKKAIEEGFSCNEIYEIANITHIPIQQQNQ